MDACADEMCPSDMVYVIEYIHEVADVEIM